MFDGDIPMWGFLISQTLIIYNTALIVKEITCHTDLCFELGHFCMALIWNMRLDLFHKSPVTRFLTSGWPADSLVEIPRQSATFKCVAFNEGSIQIQSLRNIFGEQTSKTWLIWTALKGSTITGTGSLPPKDTHTHTHTHTHRAAHYCSGIRVWEVHGDKEQKSLVFSLWAHTHAKGVRMPQEKEKN